LNLLSENSAGKKRNGLVLCDGKTAGIEPHMNTAYNLWIAELKTTCRARADGPDFRVAASAEMLLKRRPLEPRSWPRRRIRGFSFQEQIHEQ
jgi:hypothetical protein